MRRSTNLDNFNPDPKHCIKSREFCTGCAIHAPSDIVGHLPWDELELMRHNYMDNDCRHWLAPPALDELQMMREHVTDSIPYVCPNIEQPKDQSNE